MICRNCANWRHYDCRGGTWCDCQHRESANVRRGDDSNGDRSTIARLFDIPEKFVGAVARDEYIKTLRDSQTEEATHQESEAHSGKIPGGFANIVTYFGTAQ